MTAPPGEVGPDLVELVLRRMHRGGPSAAVDELVLAGLAVMAGSVVMPTPTADERVRAVLLLPEDSPLRRPVQARYEEFLPINRALRDVCTRWQCRPDGTANEHTEPGYDRAVLAELREVHQLITPVLRGLAEVLPRTSGYPGLLDHALRRLDDADFAWLASPLHDSYHTVWMRLHQELLLTLGISRDEDARVEQRLVAGRVSAVSVAEFRSRLRPVGAEQPLLHGIAASPGAAVGRIVLSARRAASIDGPVVLVADETTPEDLPGILAARAVVTRRGGTASHAAVIARGAGIPAVCGAGELSVDAAAGIARAGRFVLREGDLVSVDGTSGTVYPGAVPVEQGRPIGELSTALGWADGLRRLGVFGNADTARDARTAIENGADGIGLCRTEHQFTGDRLPLIRRVLLDRTDDRALAELVEVQRADFRELFLAVGPRPVTVRLLDAPTHEFLTDTPNREANPMLGVRGVRLALLDERLYPAQASALFSAWTEVAAEGIRPDLEIMIPLVSLPGELARAAASVRAVAAGTAVPYRLGCMVETPRAALLAGELAGTAEFLSFGTNDLTQLTYGFSRDDIERPLLARYVELGLLPASPFDRLDEHGVGALIETAVRAARAVRPDIRLGLCGEHGGDPDSIELCDRWGLDYVSCSPHRIPAARLAAARSAARPTEGAAS